jgi:hypothetical protein
MLRFQREKRGRGWGGAVVVFEYFEDWDAAWWEEQLGSVDSCQSL